MLLLSRRPWRQAAPDSWDLEEAGVCSALAEGVPGNGQRHTAVPPQRCRGVPVVVGNTTSGWKLLRTVSKTSCGKAGKVPHTDLQ